MLKKERKLIEKYKKGVGRSLLEMVKNHGFSFFIPSSYLLPHSTSHVTAEAPPLLSASHYRQQHLHAHPTTPSYQGPCSLTLLPTNLGLRMISILSCKLFLDRHFWFGWKGVPNNSSQAHTHTTH